MEFPSASFETVSEHVHGAFAMKVRNESLYDMNGVVKRGTPAKVSWKLYKFRHRNSLFFQGANFVF